MPDQEEPNRLSEDEADYLKVCVVVAESETAIDPEKARELEAAVDRVTR